MKSLKICAILLLTTFSTQGYNSILLNHLQAIQTNYIYEKNNAYGKTIQKAFQIFHQLSKHAGPMSLLQQNNIANLFLLSPQKNQEAQFNKYLKDSQNIMLVYIYAKIFQEYIAQTQTLIDQALDYLHYWQTEKFYDKLPMLRKHPIYWYHSPAHKKIVCKHVQALNDLIYQATLLLGIALHGQHQFRQIQDADEILPQLLQATDPLIKHFQTIHLPNATEPEAMFQNTVWLHQNIQVTLQNHQRILHDHAKPHHLIRHGFLYSCIALAAVGTYVLYKTHEAEMPEYHQKAIETWNYILKEYVQIPLQKLKETLWDKKILKIQKMGELAPLSASDPINIKIETTSFKVPNEPMNVTVQPEPFNVPMIGLPIAIPKFKISASQQTVELPPITVTIPPTEINAIKETLNQNKAELRNCFNANAEIISELSRDQQLNLAMAAIAPTVLVSFGAYYAGKSVYNKYIKHETWYQPMQMIVREIDKTLNKLTAEATVSFADDGMLHVLTRQLKTYISCLPNEELQLIEQDLRELSAYHLNYQQKRGVLDRMYRTYEFLK